MPWEKELKKLEQKEKNEREIRDQEAAMWRREKEEGSRKGAKSQRKRKRRQGLLHSKEERRQHKCNRE